MEEFEEFPISAMLIPMHLAPPPPITPDLFDWFAEIWIPAGGAAATVAVSVIALIVSGRAQKLARQIEAERDADLEERHQDEQAERLRALAIQEARALQRWITENENRSPWGRSSHRFDEPAPPRPLHEQARIDATVMLEQSIVPGASELLALTAFDLANPLAFAPVDHRDDDAFAQMQHARSYRTRFRIREWALDPRGAVPMLLEDEGDAIWDPEKYFRRGQDISWVVDELNTLTEYGDA